MASNDQFFQVKRGRPKKISLVEQISRERTFRSNENLDSNSLVLARKAYLKVGFSQKLRLMISILPRHVDFPSNVKLLPLLNLLEESAKKLMVSEIELATASLILSSIDWENSKFMIEETIDCCFFLAKRQLESDKILIDLLQNSLLKHYQNFSAVLCEISKTTENDIKAINSRYKELTMTGYQYNVNYNYYVDEIIRVSPPYNLSLKRPKIEKISEKVEESTSKPSQKEEYELEPLDNFDDYLSSITYHTLLPLHDYENYYQLLDSGIPSYPALLNDSEISELDTTQEEDYVSKFLNLD